MFGIGWQQIIVILLVALLFFGAKRLPEIARSLGKSVREFKKGMDASSDDDEDEKKESLKIEEKKKDETENGTKSGTSSQ